MRSRDLWYGNSPAEIVTAGGIAFGLLAIVWLVRFVARRKLKNALLTATPVDDFFLEIATRTRLSLLLFPAFHLGGRALAVPPSVSDLVNRLASLSLIAQTALWVAGLLDLWLLRTRKARLASDPASAMTVGAFRLAAVAAVWVIAVIVAIDNQGGNVGALVAGLGVGGVAVALATQNILADLFASLSIVVDKPFVLGDAIIVDTLAGTVEHIGLKTTRIRSFDGEEVIFSNADLLRSRIRNFKRMTERRSLIRVGAVYSTPPEKLEAVPMLLRQAVEKQQEARFDRAHFVRFGESALEFELAWYATTPDYAKFLDLQQAVNLDIVRAFAANGIEFAFPTRTVHLSGTGPS